MYKITIIKELKFRKGIRISDEGKDFITKLLIKNPSERLGTEKGIEEFLDHPWLINFDWEKLKNRQIRPPYEPCKVNW